MCYEGSRILLKLQQCASYSLHTINLFPHIQIITWNSTVAVELCLPLKRSNLTSIVLAFVFQVCIHVSLLDFCWFTLHITHQEFLNLYSPWVSMCYFKTLFKNKIDLIDILFTIMGNVHLCCVCY